MEKVTVQLSDITKERCEATVGDRNHAIRVPCETRPDRLREALIIEPFFWDLYGRR